MYDFRSESLKNNRLFNLQVRQNMLNMLDYLHRGEPLESFSPFLDEVKKSLFQHFNDPSGELAACAFSQYLQNLVYYIGHNIADNSYDNAKYFFDVLLNRKDFFHKTSSQQIIVWYDPKTGWGALNTLANNYFVEALQKLLKKMKKICGQDVETLKKWLAHKNLSDYSALNAAAIRGNYEIVSAILIMAKQAFHNDPQGFENFLNSEDNTHYKPIENAAKAGHAGIIRLLSQYHAEVANPQRNVSYVGSSKKRKSSVAHPFFQQKYDFVNLKITIENNPVKNSYKKSK